jgi:hypothetical protein
MKEWKEDLLKDESASIVVEAPTGSRRKTVRLAVATSLDISI